MSKHVPKLSRHKASGKAVVRLSGRDIYLAEFGTKEAKLEYVRLTKEWQAMGCSSLRLLD